MPVNRQTVRELSRTTLYNITSSGQAWRAFLDAAARLYKYSFPEQVLIYAQEPEATACANIEQVSPVQRPIELFHVFSSNLSHRSHVYLT